jgi:WD40 repeat protein
MYQAMDLATGKLLGPVIDLKELIGGESTVSGDGRFLILPNGEIWNPRTGKLVLRPNLPPGVKVFFKIVCCAAGRFAMLGEHPSSPGRLSEPVLVSGRVDSRNTVWTDLDVDRVTAPMQTRASPIMGTDGRRIAIGMSKEVVIYDAPTLHVMGEPLVNDGYVYFLSFSSDGRTLAVGGSYSSIVLWDVETEQRYEAVLRANVPLAFSADGNMLLASDDTNVTLFNLSPTDIGAKLRLQANRPFSDSERNRYLGR